MTRFPPDFEICRSRDGRAGRSKSVSAGRTAEYCAFGVATVTAAEEAVICISRLRSDVEQAAKGASGAALLRKCLKEPQI